jgi:uncharacterized protein with ParB-like and HNH nuclease domain
MNVEPRFLSVLKLFTEQKIYHIPKYQRNYAWESEQIEDFISDLISCKQIRETNEEFSHFFGGVVTVRERRTGSNCDTHEVVDGQQRLTTFTLFMVALHNVYAELLTDSTEAFSTDEIEVITNRVNKIKNAFMEYKEEINGKLVPVDKLSVSGADHDYYRAIKSGVQGASDRVSHKRLDSAYKKFKGYFKSIIKEAGDLHQAYEEITKVHKAFDDGFTILLIETNSKSDAYRLFQVLNDRGISLTDGDMLRAKTLELLESSNRSDKIDQVNNLWDSILSDTTSNIMNFLVYFYAGRTGKRCNSTSVYDNYLDKIFGVKDKLSLTDEEADGLIDLVEEIFDYSLKFKQLINGSWPFAFGQPITAKERDRLNIIINKLDHKRVLPLLMNACSLDQKKFYNIVHYVELMFFRYKLVCNQNISKMDNIYLKHAMKIREGIFSLLDFKKDLLGLKQFAPDELFTSSINALKYSSRPNGNKLIKYYLLMLEDYSKWYYADQRSTIAKKMNDNATSHDFNNISIEHIYPQNPEDRDALLEPLKNNIENLTIYNCRDNANELGNKPFDEKKVIFSGADQYVLNSRVAKFDVWDSDSLINRKDDLNGMALSIFTL